ncbi:MAG TPA: ATP-binding protein [Acidimicrobiales bacterium]|nr:ATP-binding protein [Acidimicrobiales bacterium]
MKQFLPTPTAVRDARVFVADQLTPGNVANAAILLVSELATNAVEHARTSFEVRVRTLPVVHIEVSDNSKVMPVERSLPPDAEHGRGLRIVQSLAQTWGTEETDTGKMVWFDLHPGAGVVGEFGTDPHSAGAVSADGLG